MMRRRSIVVLAGALALTGLTGGTAAARVPSEVVARPSAGCDSDAPPAPGESKLTLTSRGADRTYIRHVPPQHGTTPVPLVVDFHGYSEGAQIHTLASRLGAFGDVEGFVTLTPDSGRQPARWDLDKDSGDLRFVGALLDEAESTLCVDTARIFVTGLSNGATMTSGVACAYADRIAAVAPVAGVTSIAPCDADRPVPVVAFHGTEDPYLPFEGGLGPAALELPAADGSDRTLGDQRAEAGDEAADDEDVVSVPETLTAWAERNGCKAKKPRQQEIAADVVGFTWRCPQDAAVQLYKVIGGGHAWPGSEFSRSIESVVGPTTFSIDANEIMWAFFETHPLPDDDG